MFNFLSQKISFNAYAVLPYLASLLGVLTVLILFFFYVTSKRRIFIYHLLLFLSFFFYQFVIGSLFYLQSYSTALMRYQLLVLFMVLHIPCFYFWVYFLTEKKYDAVFYGIMAASFIFIILDYNSLLISSLAIRFNYFKLIPTPLYFVFLFFYYSSLFYASHLIRKKNNTINLNISFPDLINFFLTRIFTVFILLLSDQINLLGIADIPPLSSAACIIFVLILIFKIFKNYVLYYDVLKKNYLQTITGLADLLDNKDNYTYRHSYRVAHYAVFLARLLELDEESVRCIEKASLLHDIGKIGIPDDVLLKKEKLTSEEWELIKSHAEEGATILNIVDFLKKESEIIKHHHERYDGKGYPDHLTFDRIPIEAQVISVVDTFDAMTSKRPYRGRYSFHEVYEEFERVKGKQFSSDIVECLLTHWDDLLNLYKKLERQIKKTSVSGLTI